MTRPWHMIGAMRDALAVLTGLAAFAACEPERPRDTGLAMGFEAVPVEVTDLVDMVDLADDMRPVEMGPRATPPVLAAGAPHVFFMNFSDGETSITKGPDDARTNTSQICSSMPHPRWDGAAGCGDRDGCIRTIANIVQDQWKDFNVVLATKRPSQAVSYSMVMIGPMSGKAGTCNFQAGVGGLAPFDCGNRVEENVSYAFACNASPQACAIVISQEQAHTFGLAHTTDPCDIMFPSVTQCGAATFPDRSNQITGMGCSGATQNSYQMLKTTLGEWPSGVSHPRDWESCFAGPPSVQITSPLDGERSDGTFFIRGRVFADCPVRSVTIAVLGKGLKLKPVEGEVVFDRKVENLLDGDYLVRVTVEQSDTLAQTAEAAVAVRVDSRPTCTTSADCPGAAAGDVCQEGRCTAPLPTSGGCRFDGADERRRPGELGWLGVAVLLAEAARRRHGGRRCRGVRSPPAANARGTLDA